MIQPIQFSRKMLDVFPEVYTYIQGGLIESFIIWVTDSKKRRASYLSKFLKDQIENPSEKLLKVAEKVPFTPDYDDQIFECFRWVKDNLDYKGDAETWKISDYWATSEELLNLAKLEGDCEDGSMLIYILARLKGVPANRMMLWAGEAENPFDNNKIVGHCNLFYKPKSYPLHFASMDWCYYPNLYHVESRNLFCFSENEVHEFEQTHDWVIKTSKYKSSWFFFNENWSASRYSLKRL